MRETLLGKTPGELKEIALKVGLPPFAGKQIAGWMYGRKVSDIDSMTNISKVGRDRLKEEYDLGLTLPSTCQVSRDGTRKYLFPLGEGNAVEAVMTRTMTGRPCVYHPRQDAGWAASSA